MFGACFVIEYFVYFKLCNHLDGEERVGCFTLIVFLSVFCGSSSRWGGLVCSV